LAGALQKDVRHFNALPKVQMYKGATQEKLNSIPKAGSKNILFLPYLSPVIFVQILFTV